ncbi:class I SAM-dependent methyltransferase [Saprospira grandis]|uniref:Class I SAM-dependent methyltransferase n=1 Tax=Saprospira grandis (strain Lewin) TaxID=984262 RepID=H6L4G2_SAPGL|nr:class I SAM-dependent methyltransferase [Saprospira grandis]AFC22841.1 hypothetical protein SGRA_0096 [Saprospira grandis str. Lewin]
MKKYLKSIKQQLIDNPYQAEGQRASDREKAKTPSRTDIINYLLAQTAKHNAASEYLEIGVRNPDHNFNLIQAKNKYSVDPGVEFEENPVDFKLTSDQFFEQLAQGKVLSPNHRFDVIFIDGLHLAEQVDRDIEHALQFIQPHGFVVLHDCNPPTEYHAREDYAYHHSPARGYWNGTTWKAFFKWRQEQSIQSCCIDSDWGVGILSKTQPLGPACPPQNPFFEYKVMEANRKEQLGLLSFDELKEKLA